MRQTGVATDARRNSRERNSDPDPKSDSDFTPENPPYRGIGFRFRLASTGVSLE
jgi:hypothetical protein